MNNPNADEAVLFVDAVHPTHAVRPMGCWVPKDTPIAVAQTSGRQCLNIHGAISAPRHVGRRRVASAKRGSRMTRIVTYVRRIRRIPLMFCLLLAAQALPATAKVVGGHGVESCGSWLDHRRQWLDHRQGGSTDMQWVLGYLSAVAEWSDFDPLADTDDANAWYWLDNYCSALPERPLAEALDAFIRRGK